MNQPSTILYQISPRPQRRQRTKGGKPTSGKNAKTLRLRPRHSGLVMDLYTNGYMHTDHIEKSGRFDTVSPKHRRRVVQRTLKNLTDAQILRRIEQPIYPSERAGSKPYIYALGTAGAALVTQQLGVAPQAVYRRPKARERNIAYMAHALAIVDYWTALKRSCREAGFGLEQWVTDRILQKEVERVEILDKQGVASNVGVVPDAAYALGLPQALATCLLEYDRATVTLDPRSSWARKGWRRKVLGLLGLVDNGRLKARYGAGALWVHIVTKSEARLENMVQVTEEAASERAHHFWFTGEDRLAHNILTDRIWRVAGKPGHHAIL